MKKFYLLVGLLVVGLVAGFFVGKYAFVSAPAVRTGQSSQAGGTRQFAARSGSGAGIVSGQVASVGDNTLSVSLRTGGSEVVLVSSSTKVMKSIEGAASDVAASDTVLVTGTQNSDGSVTADTIQIQPATPVRGGSQ